MFEGIIRFFRQFTDVFAALPPSRKIFSLAVLAGVLAGFISLMIWANQPKFEVLYAGLTPQDAGEVVAKLRERKTPFKLEANGTTVMVPGEVLQETRLALATEGLPRGGAVGMELFNKTALGTTDFVQRLNYQRAVQGELERTIAKFPEVDQVRVHLTMPKESLFMEEAREPSASVVLKLYPGRSLSQAQIQGIVYLVASSVEGLKDSRVSVVDTSGGLLYRKDEEAEAAVLTGTQIQYRKNLEKGLASRVASMLERVVGPGKAVARVNAELDFSRITTTEESFDPDRTVVRSEQRVSEKSSGPGQEAAGVPSARYELGAGEAPAAGAGGAQPEVYEKREETTNYEIARVNRQTIKPAGGIEKLSVAVIVDGKYEEKTEGEKTTRVFVPRSEAELTSLEEVVKSAVGFDETRGDTVVVTSVPFFIPEKEAPPGILAAPWLNYLRQAARPALNVLLIVLFFLFVVRPLIAWLQRESRVAAPPAPPPEALPPEEERVALPEARLEPGVIGPEQVRQLAQQQPDRTAELIRHWIRER